jgi:hypothetical protein
VHTGTAPVIRLEGPLALCHDSLLAASGTVLDTVSHAGGSRSPPRRLDRLCVSLVTGAASGLNARIAAVSPTFGRLYEGTDRCSPGQTTPKRQPVGHQSLTAVTPATARASNLCRAVPNVAERLARARKTVSFGRCCFIPKRRRQRSTDSRSACWPAESTYRLERRSREPSEVCCGTVVAVLSTPVDNCVDSLSSERPIELLRRIRGSRR